jgi:hypothetical protein
MLILPYHLRLGDLAEVERDAEFHAVLRYLLLIEHLHF